MAAQEQPASRRTFIAAGLGSIAALVVSALGRPDPVAANGEVVHVGDQFTSAISATSITNVTNTETVIRAQSEGGGAAFVGWSGGNTGITTFGGARGVYGITTEDAGRGVEGHAVAGTGVLGHSESGVGVLGQSGSSIAVSGASTSWIGVAGSSGATYGVYGEANGSGSGAIGVHGTSTAGVGILGKSRAAAQPGVIGWSGNNSTGLQGISNANEANPPAPRAKTGVYGYAAQDSASSGVAGYSPAGNGVRGEAATGVGVQGVASDIAGYAIRGSGRVRFDKVSGLATIPPGATSITITPGTDVTSQSFALLTPMLDLGMRRLWFTRDTTNNRITIRVSSSTTYSTYVSWLLLS